MCDLICDVHQLLRLKFRCGQNKCTAWPKKVSHHYQMIKISY